MGNTEELPSYVNDFILQFKDINTEDLKLEANIAKMMGFRAKHKADWPKVANILSSKLGAPEDFLTNLLNEHKNSKQKPQPADQKKSKTTPIQIADSYRRYCANTRRIRVYWRGSYYDWDGTKYTELDKEVIEIDITKFMAPSELREDFSKSILASVEMLYRADVSISSKIKENTFIKGPKGQRFISCRNGIIDLNKFIKGDDDCLIDHTPRFFTVSSLPYNYRPKAVSEVLQKYLDKSQPDQQGQSFLQEWAGYNLTHDTKLETIVILQGKGKNGKSVFAILLKMLLGDGNFSAVAPEDFGKDSKLLMLLGKRANICDDTNENVKINFGTLKLVVSGSDVSVERKYKTAITFAPTAKHTMIGNQYMVVSDRSDGTIRRIFPIHFGTQIPKHERDLRLIDRDFWYDSKEIEGVLYWALLGLRRLSKNNMEWTKVDASEKIKQEIKEESQPEIGFFKQCLEFTGDASDKIGSKQLHDVYSKWMGKSKAQLKQITLIKALLEYYPESSLSKNAVTGQNWEGRQRFLDKLKIVVPQNPQAYSGSSSHNQNELFALQEALQASKKESEDLRAKQTELLKKNKNNEENIIFLNNTISYLWKKIETGIPSLELNIKDVPLD